MSIHYPATTTLWLSEGGWACVEKNNEALTMDNQLKSHDKRTVEESSEHELALSQQNAEINITIQSKYPVLPLFFRGRLGGPRRFNKLHSPPLFNNL